MAAIVKGERVAARAALRVLRQSVGLWGTVRVFAKLLRNKLARAPFRALGPPRDERDRLSRRQCGDLVLLDRALATEFSKEERVSLLREIVMAGAGPFLDAMLPPFPVEQLAGLAPTLVESFFNAEGEVQLSDDSGFKFEVNHCRFVELLKAVDAFHLGPLFCEADEAYFDGVRRPIVLRRTRTLARGGRSCDFHFQPAATSKP